MERWIRGVFLTVSLAFLILSNRFVNLGRIQGLVVLVELVVLILTLLKFSAYSREELGLGGEFSISRHVLFPFTFFILPLGVVFFVPHADVSPWKFVLYLLNFVLTAGLCEELLFRGLLFASLEERFGGLEAAIGNSVVHWLLHYWVGLNASQLIAALVLSSYRLTFRRIEPLIVTHALWDAVFIALSPRFTGSSALVLMVPFAGALISLLVYFSDTGNTAVGTIDYQNWQ